MRAENPFYIIILLFLFNTGDGSALLMQGTSNGSDTIHGPGGHNADVEEIKRMVLNLTTEVDNLKRQSDQERITIQVLNHNLTVLSDEKKLLQNRVFFLEAELNKLNASKPPFNDELMAYLSRTEQIVQTLATNEEYDKNLTLRLNEAENKNAIYDRQNKNLTQRLNEIHDALTANEAYDKNLTQQLTDSIKNLHDIKVQMRYTSLSLMDIHSKTDKLDTTLTRNLSFKFEDQIRDVYGQITNITQKVAFTAGVSSGSRSWSSGTLVFDRIVYNIGGGYDSSTGVFTSPVDGHFVFFVNVQGSSYDVKTYLVLNGSAKVTTLVYYISERYEAGPNLAVLRLIKGDRVWVKHYTGTGYYTTGDAPVTTFSGFLI
ncbi:uncharacterized protein LOC134257063 [Saccostrea cucullata]|uniref:uncharacterized protein LOC134257063 n=1 Tax=Saccostrea cuccullata TaxID=36930 RepID=UPI002ED62B2B